MAKFIIVRSWIAGLIVLVAGLIIGGVALALLLANGGHWTQVPGTTSWNFIPTLDGFFWTMLSLTIVGFTIAAAGSIVQLVAWIGALVNTYQFEDKTWFVVLLGGGLVGLGFPLVGFAVMLAYLLAGPDGMTVGRPHRPLSESRTEPRTGALVPTR